VGRQENLLNLFVQGNLLEHGGFNIFEQCGRRSGGIVVGAQLGGVPQREKPQLLLSQQIESAQFGLAHAVESEVGGEEAVDVGGEVEDEDEEGEDEEDGEEVPLVEVEEGETAAYCGVEIVDVEGGATGGGEVVLDVVVLRDQVLVVFLFV
jgi:hypothetical protein